MTCSRSDSFVGLAEGWWLLVSIWHGEARELQRERIKIARDRLSTGKRVMILRARLQREEGSESCNRWEGLSRASGIWPATTKKSKQDVSKMTVYIRGSVTLTKVSFFNSIFSKQRRTPNLILNIERKLCDRIPANVLLGRSQSWGCQVSYATSLLDIRKKESPKTKHTKYPPKLIKMGKEKQAPTSNLPSLHLPPASSPTLFALRVLGEQRPLGTLCFVTRFQPREGDEKQEDIG